MTTCLERLHPVCRKLGLPEVRTYDLRHAHASLQLEAGTPLLVISKRLGHSSNTTSASTYVHVRDQWQQDATARFADFMAPRSEGQEAQS